jgi:putative iron-regulated protein
MKQALVLVAALALAAPAGAAPAERDVLEHYADLARAAYGDSLAGAQALQAAVARLVDAPSRAHLGAARSAWRAARVPYVQTEAFRFGNPIVDAWEVRVNSWPLDEGLIDYVQGGAGGSPSGNPYGAANVIANPELLVSGRRLDAQVISKQLLEELNRLGGIETNVATGYHAIEFLLWGQDLHGTGPGAGERPATDFDPARCTGGHCRRRAAYLRAATDLLVDDLQWMTAQWAPGGSARRALADRTPSQGLSAIVTGMGRLSFGELAGERMKLALMLHDPEEEQDCFSDNTHWSFYYDVVGIQNVYTGSYARPGAEPLHGPSLSDLVAAASPEADAELRRRMQASLAAMQAIVDSAEKRGVAFDQLIAPDDARGNALVHAAIEALLAQTRAIERVAAVLGVDTAVAGGPTGLPAGAQGAE